VLGVEAGRIREGGAMMEVPQLIGDGEDVILKVAGLALIEDDSLDDLKELLIAHGLMRLRGKILQFIENRDDEIEFSREVEVEKIKDVVDIFLGAVLKKFDEEGVGDWPMIALAEMESFL
jgi:hypothetical protein